MKTLFIILASLFFCLPLVADHAQVDELQKDKKLLEDTLKKVDSGELLFFSSTEPPSEDQFVLVERKYLDYNFVITPELKKPTPEEAKKRVEQITIYSKAVSDKMRERIKTLDKEITDLKAKNAT